MCFIVTSRFQDNFLYFKTRGFGVSGIWKDISDFSLAGQCAMSDESCLKSSMRISVSYEFYDVAWYNAFVGPLILGQGIKSI